MCDTCGCNITHANQHLIKPGGKLSRVEDGREAVTVLQNLLSENDHVAGHNREHFDRHGVLAINLMSSPGSGKTALLEASVELLADKFNTAQFFTWFVTNYPQSKDLILSDSEYYESKVLKKTTSA